MSKLTQHRPPIRPGTNGIEENYTCVESVVEAKLKPNVSSYDTFNNNLKDLKTPIIQLCEAYASSIASNTAPPWDSRRVFVILVNTCNVKN